MKREIEYRPLIIGIRILLLQLLRHPGAGRFVGSGAEHDDVAVARNLEVAPIDVVRGDPQGAGDRVRRHVQLERRPRIHDRQTGAPGRQAVPPPGPGTTRAFTGGTTSAGTTGSTG